MEVLREAACAARAAEMVEGSWRNGQARRVCDGEPQLKQVRDGKR